MQKKLVAPDSEAIVVAVVDYLLTQKDPAKLLATIVSNIQEARKQAALGYEFNPCSYTYSALVACGHAERAVAGIHMLLSAYTPANGEKEAM
jgi:hypothetical protein